MHFALKTLPEALVVKYCDRHVGPLVGCLSAAITSLSDAAPVAHNSGYTTCGSPVSAQAYFQTGIP